MNELEKAVSSAHTYLQRNPGDPLLTRTLNYYKSLFDVEEFLIDHEEKPYEVFFILDFSDGGVPSCVTLFLPLRLYL